MVTTLAAVTLVVPDYDEARDYYTAVLGFCLAEDYALPDGKRWVRVTPSGGGTSFLLARAANETQRLAIGNQTGGRVFLFLHTDNFAEEYARLAAAGVTFTGLPRDETYGRVVVFVDRYGNKWDLIEPRPTATAMD